MDNLDDIKRKITALVAKAQSTDNEHEALAFMAKATAMLEKYQIELWQLGDAGDPVGEDVLLKWRDATPSLNDHHILYAVARYYGCRNVISGSWEYNSVGRLVKGKRVRVIGRESSRITVGLMFPFVMQQCHEAGARLTQQGYGPKAKCTLRVVNALVFRINRLIEEAKASARTVEETETLKSRALVVVAELDAYIASAIGELGKGRKTRISTSGAARDAAEKISLHRQATGTGQLKISAR